MDENQKKQIIEQVYAEYINDHSKDRAAARLVENGIPREEVNAIMVEILKKAKRQQQTNQNPSQSENHQQTSSSSPNKHHWGWVIFIIVALAIGLFAFGKVNSFF